MAKLEQLDFSSNKCVVQIYKSEQIILYLIDN